MITKAEAIIIGESGLWKDMPVRERCWLVLESGLCCYPFGQFHEDLEACLGRPVWTHELGLAFDEIKREFLGETEPPAMQDFLDLIPEEKRIVVVLDKKGVGDDIDT